MAQDHKANRRHDRHSQQYYEDNKSHVRRHEDNAKYYSDIEHLRPDFDYQGNLGNDLRRTTISFHRRVPSAPPPASIPPTSLKRSASTGQVSRLGQSRPPDVPTINIVQPNDQHWGGSPESSVQPDSSAGSPRHSSVFTDPFGERPFRYSDLQPLEIRLVRIFPARMSTMKCDIIHASLANVPEYVAISYAWGDAGDQESINLDGTKQSISKSLSGALSALRERDNEVLIWADALCINQQDMVEKSSQIKLMTSIYDKAKSVAIWLGHEADDSCSAVTFLKVLRDKTRSGERYKSWILSRENEENLAAVARLFSRSYWQRLWVVQEVFNAADIVVYCGSDVISWRGLKEASEALYHCQSDLSDHFAKISSCHHVHTLFNEGPRSLLDRQELCDGDGALLDVLRRCRRKVSEKPQDKVFGLLGVLPEKIRDEFRVDYTDSVKEVFTDVVDFLVTTTSSLDVICESIHFPQHSNPANLQSWVPDWSHNPELKSLSSSYGFSASKDFRARWKFRNRRRNELEISAIYLDTVKQYGVSVGTQCTLGDYLMAFLHWRALLVEAFGRIKQSAESKRKHEEFCRILNLDQNFSESRSDEWLQACYHVFSSLIQERLPFLEIDSELQSFATAHADIRRDDRRQFLQDYFGEHMMGRAFCITESHRMGMGSGAMLAGDIIVVPFGCRTPVLLRADPFSPSKHRLVGDIYLDKFMRGRALDLDRWEPSRRRDYVLV